MLIIEHVTLQKIVAHDFRYDLRINSCAMRYIKRTDLLSSILLLVAKRKESYKLYGNTYDQ